MKRESREVLLGDIDTSDMSFVVSPSRLDENLLRSVERFGILNPPLLARKTGKTAAYRIVCGFRRITAAYACGYPTVAAAVCSPDMPDRQMLEISLCDNLSHRDFNLMEKAGAVDRLLRYHSRETVARDWLGILGLPAATVFIDRVSGLLNLEPEIRSAVTSGELAEKTAYQLSDLDLADRSAVWDLFAATNMSTSKKTEVLAACSDIARRDNSSIASIADSEAVREILGRAATNRSQKADLVLKWLRNKRFPRLAGLRKRFEQSVRCLELPRNATVSPPPFFEGGTCSMCIMFDSPAALEETAGRIAGAARSETMKKIFEDL